MKLTPHQAKYYAYDLTRRAATGLDRLSMSLFDAAVDLNPHQIEAALFAVSSPLSKGVILADEVGLGKTIEAGIVLCQLWAERKRQLLVICPASLRKQWALELEEKFNLPVLVLDSRKSAELQGSGHMPFSEQAILIMSLNYAYANRETLKEIAWDLVVIDEAHKLRNAYRRSNKVGQGIRWATEDCRKLLLTATPLQNSLLELYGLSTIIDEHIFGDDKSFRVRYVNNDSNLDDLKQRLLPVCKRTLRSEVAEYINYTDRQAITCPFTPTDKEHGLYEAVSEYLQHEGSYALPKRSRQLITLILRKLLASSSRAIAATLDKLRAKLLKLQEKAADDASTFIQELAVDEDIDEEMLDEMMDEDEAYFDDEESNEVDPSRLAGEIQLLEQLSAWAWSIETDTKSEALLKALDIGFEKMAATGAQKKALIFTEFRRTQEYLKEFLEKHGYSGQIVLFNGVNNGTEATAIYDAWVRKNQDTGRVSGSRAVNVRTALIEQFRDEATIMIATEAGAEGINLQFCSLVINYDLPWNPQRVEQRIGRCHRYGQHHDVVVINFLNERNAADKRVLELLTEKFNLFSGVFGASDEVLGSIEPIDFEQRILAIYQQCRTLQEIDAAFQKLREELDEQIRSRLADTRRIIFENFDEDVHQRLRIQLDDARVMLDTIGRRFWLLTQYMLSEQARFDDVALLFDLLQSPREEIPSGRYHLITKERRRDKNDDDEQHGAYLYRLSHPLGEYVTDNAKTLETPTVHIVFNVTNHPTRLHVVEELRGLSGYITLIRLIIDSYEHEEYLLFSGFTDAGVSIDPETVEKMFNCSGTIQGKTPISIPVKERMYAEVNQHIRATVNRSLEQSNKHFIEARDKLDKWADDLVLMAEKELSDTKDQIRALRRQARQAIMLDAQHEIQRKIQGLEQQQRKQRQEIFQVEDEIMEKRDQLIDALEKRLSQRTENETLFTVRWTVE